MFAGAGVKGGLVLGASDKDGDKVIDTGWKHKEQPRIENVVATMYSALGIDWSKASSQYAIGPRLRLCRSARRERLHSHR